jgi:hypothetical protein
MGGCGAEAETDRSGLKRLARSRMDSALRARQDGENGPIDPTLNAELRPASSPGTVAKILGHFTGGPRWNKWQEYSGGIPKIG